MKSLNSKKKNNKVITISLSEKLLKIINEMLKLSIFSSRSEFIRFCTQFTLIHFEKSKLMEVYDINKIKRYIIKGKEIIEINGKNYKLMK